MSSWVTEEQGANKENTKRIQGDHKENTGIIMIDAGLVQ